MKMMMLNKNNNKNNNNHPTSTSTSTDYEGTFVDVCTNAKNVVYMLADTVTRLIELSSASSTLQVRACLN